MTVLSETNTSVSPNRSTGVKSELLEDVGADSFKYKPHDPASRSDLTTRPETTSSASTSSTSRTSWTQWWRRRPTGERYEAISGFHKWEGRVVELDGEVFTAEITSLDPGKDLSPVYADFELDLLKPDVVEVGDVVYITARMVNVGQGFSPSKTLSVRLRRIGNWTESEVAQIAEKAHAGWVEMQDLID